MGFMHRAITTGCRSISVFHSARTESYAGVAGDQLTVEDLLEDPEGLGQCLSHSWSFVRSAASATATSPHPALARARHRVVRMDAVRVDADT
jgi:hypothetical protein